MTNKNAFKLYDEFQELKANLNEKALEEAIYTDFRGSEKIRPVCLYNNFEDFAARLKSITRWKYLADSLTREDNERFPSNSTLLRPFPEVYIEPYKVSIRVQNATSTRKVKKAQIVKRMQAALASEKLSAKISGDWAIAEKLAKELENMQENDSEEYYRIRTDGYNDVIAFVTLEKGAKPMKVRVSKHGLFIHHSDPNWRVEMPDNVRDMPKRESYEDLGIFPIPCSLPMKGRLYRESELQAAKRRPKQPAF